MSRPRPTREVEVTLSYRLNEVGPPCLYLLVFHVRSDGQRSVVHSQHLTGAPERLVDLATTLARELSLEHFLTLTSPF